MADIEERAEEWASDYEMNNDLTDFGPGIAEVLVIAYLAGSAQTQRDYVAYYEGRG